MKSKKLFAEIKRHPVLMMAGYLFVIGWFAAFMTHGRSTPIYLLIPQLQYVQFSWRFLTIVIFAFSFLIGIIPKVFYGLKRVEIPVVGFFLKIVGSFSQTAVVFLLAGILVLANWNYFKPQGGKMGPLTDNEKFSGVAWELQQAAGAMDYLPIAAKKVPTEFKSGVAEVMQGSALITDSSSGSYWSLFKVQADEDTTIRINTFYFPGWRVFVKESSNSVEIPTYVPEEEEWGRMWIDLPAGENFVYAQFMNTPIRTWSNIVSLLSWLFLIGVLVSKRIALKLS